MRGKKATMQIIITERDSAGRPYTAQSADGRYTWFTGSESRLHDSAVGRAIYQMRYLRLHGFGSDPLPPEVERDARAFWAALHAEERAAEAAERERRIAESRAMPRISDEEFFARRAKERAFDDLHNEGGEGFNPYRAT